MTKQEKTVRVNIKNSYIISFKDGPGRGTNLREQLAYLETIIDNESEIIIVEQDDVSKLGWLNELPINYTINHIFVHNTAIFNKGRGCNIGAKHARGSKLVFLDVDVLLEREVYSEALEKLNSYDVVDPYKEIAFMSRHETEKFILRKFAKQIPFKYIESCVITGGAFFINKNKFLQIKGFDENISGWGYEDSVLDIKIKNAGLQCIQLTDKPAVHMWHPATSTGGMDINKNDPYYINIEHNKKIYNRYTNILDTKPLCQEIKQFKPWGVRARK